MSRRAKSSPLVGRVERLDGGNPLLQPHIIAIPGISNPLAGAPAEVSGLKSKGKGKKQPDGQAEVRNANP